MNELNLKFGSKLVILGFPCNQFGHQENTKNGEEILNSLKHVRPGNGFEPNAGLQLFAKVEVNGKNAHPAFKFLRDNLPFPQDDPIRFTSNPLNIIWEPVTRADISWNFEKFIVTPDGRPYKRYSPGFQTASLQEDIKDLIEKFNL